MLGEQLRVNPHRAATQPSGSGNRPNFHVLAEKHALKSLSETGRVRSFVSLESNAESSRSVGRTAVHFYAG